MAWLYRGDPLGDVLEVGNVLQHYGDVLDVPTRRIVDRYETGPHVENLDVFDITGRYDTIITISTVEHVGWDPPEPRTPGRSVEAIEHLASLLTFRRDGDGWVLTDDLTFLPYGATTRWAESVFIGEFRS